MSEQSRKSVIHEMDRNINRIWGNHSETFTSPWLKQTSIYRPRPHLVHPVPATLVVQQHLDPPTKTTEKHPSIKQVASYQFLILKIHCDVTSGRCFCLTMTWTFHEKRGEQQTHLLTWCSWKTIWTICTLWGGGDQTVYKRTERGGALLLTFTSTCLTPSTAFQH